MKVNEAFVLYARLHAYLLSTVSFILPNKHLELHFTDEEREV
jgi:hypothetical protein